MLSRRRGQGLKLDAQTIDPLAVGPGVGELRLDFSVVDDAALLKVDQEHFAGLQAPFFDNFVFRNGQGAGFGRHDDHIIIGNEIACGAKAIAIQSRTNLATVGKSYCGRAVPWLHHGCVVLVERAAAWIHVCMLFPRFRNHHHHGVGEGIARVHQQFQAVVEGGRVRLTFVDDWIELFEIITQHGGLHHAFAGAQPVEVAFDSVDLAIVGDHAVGVGKRPGGKGICGKALVHEGNRGNGERIR